MHILSSNIDTPRAAIKNTSSAEQTTPDLREFHNVLKIVAAVQGVDPDLILTSSRSRADVALCRQIAMYIAHVVLGYSMKQTGELFNRDRTTVSHACGRIEDMRDDKNFDAALASLEQILSFSHISKFAANKKLAG